MSVSTKIDTLSPVTIQSATSIAHLEYDPKKLPSVPSDAWTRFVCISDTHSRTFPVPPGDVLLHSGDLTETGTCEEFKITIEWLYSLPHPIKIIIAGNHDLTLHQGWYDKEYKRWHRKEGKQDVGVILEMLKGPEAQKAGLVYLQDELHEFQTKKGGRKWSIYGSPWSPEFYNWAFNYDRGKSADEIVSQFPKADILLTHGPPYDILDVTERTYEHVGCESLTARLPMLRPRLHLFGHIHEAHGAEIQTYPLKFTGADAKKSESLPQGDNTVFVNAANWPAGPRAEKDGKEVEFGEAPFQPVIIDLLDEVDK